MIFIINVNVKQKFIKENFNDNNKMLRCLKNLALIFN